jgi:hypothetical protein
VPYTDHVFFVQGQRFEEGLQQHQHPDDIGAALIWILGERRGQTLQLVAAQIPLA